MFCVDFCGECGIRLRKRGGRVTAYRVSAGWSERPITWLQPLVRVS